MTVCIHGSEIFRQEDGCFPDDCSCSITRRRGFVDGKQGHPPAYEAGLIYRGRAL